MTKRNPLLICRDFDHTAHSHQHAYQVDPHVAAATIDLAGVEQHILAGMTDALGKVFNRIFQQGVDSHA